MKSIKKLIAAAAIFAALSMSHSVHAREIRVHTAGKFNRAINRSPLAAALFYQESKESRHYRKSHDETAVALREIRSLSRSFSYKEGDLHFIKANSAKGDLEDLLEEYQIKGLPALILFKDGEAVQDQDGKIAMLTDLIGESKIKKFIEEYLGDELADRIEAKAEERARRAEAAAYYWATSPYWYGGYGYYGWPSYGYGYGYPRGYVGFGFGI